MKGKKTITVYLILALCLLALSSCASTEINEDAKNDVQQVSQESTSEEKKVIIGNADYPQYISLSDLEKKSDFIIYGTVITESCEWMSLRIHNESDDANLNPGGETDDDLALVTVYEVSVIDCYKAPKDTPETIKVLTLGGETEDAVYKIDSSPEIAASGKYIFFLSESAIVENGGWLLNDTQALYSVNGDEITGVTNDGVELSFEELNKMKQ